MKVFLIDPLLDDRLAEVKRRFEGVEEALSSPEVLADPTRIRELSQERSWLEPIVICGSELRAALKECEGAIELIGTSEDPEMAQLAEEEARVLQDRIEILTGKAKELLIPPDPLGDRPAVIEIRAGTGGDEAGLFAADLMRMYRLYAEQAGWTIELVDVSEGIPGAVKEVVFTVRGKGVYGRLRRESGVHRVQRVPATESQGRIHTSAATVAVLPEAEDVDVDIDPSELRIDTFRSSGPGGQSVNTTDSAIRVTHIPTGLVVSCQDEKSQHKNKAKALKVLRSRLLDLKIAESEAERARDRKTQIGTGDRSAKIRTYNFPQNRVTDHRISLTLYRLSEILDGDLEEVTTALRLAEQEERMEDHEA